MCLIGTTNICCKSHSFCYKNLNPCILIRLHTDIGSFSTLGPLAIVILLFFALRVRLAFVLPSRKGQRHDTVARNEKLPSNLPEKCTTEAAIGREPDNFSKGTSNTLRLPPLTTSPAATIYRSQHSANRSLAPLTQEHKRLISTRKDQQAQVFKDVTANKESAATAPRQPLVDLYIYYFLVLTFVVLPTSSTAILRTFHCEALADNNEYMIVDYNLQCYTSEHYAYLLFCGIMILVYPVGIPLLVRRRYLHCLFPDYIYTRFSSLEQYFVLLFRRRSHINPKCHSLEASLRQRSEDQTLRSLSFLYMYYRPEFWYFE